MTRHRLAWIVALGLALGLGPALHAQTSAAPATQPDKKAARERPAKDKAAKDKAPKLTGYYAMILKELAFEGEVRDKYVQAVQARDQALEAWDAQNKAALDQARQDLAQAKAEKLEDAAAAADLRVRELDTARARLDADRKLAIRAVLSAEHNGMVDCYNLYTGQLARYKAANLSEEQKAKVKQVCLSFASQMGALKLDDAKGHLAIRDKMRAEIEKSVLTTDQLAAWQAASQPKAKPAPAPAATTQPAKPDAAAK